MTVEVKMGILRDRLLVDRSEYEIHRGREGWRRVVDSRGGGRVRYDSWRDRIEIESPEGILQIRFRWRNTTFPWRGRTFRVMPTQWSRVTIVEQGRPVVEARYTWSGIRLDALDPEFHAIEKELAIGLAQRALAFAMAMAPLG